MLSIDNLRAYQHKLVEFITTCKKCALFVDMGLGKTIVSLTALTHIKPTKTLIIAPLRVANTVWHTEAKNWTHTQDITFSIVTGNVKQRHLALQKNVDCYVINRENVSWLMTTLGDDFDFDCMIIDESSSFKSHSSQRFKVLRNVIDKLEHTILLTGTPCPNTYMDLWSQLYLLDSGTRLGKNITAYRNRYTTVSPYNRYQYKFSKVSKLTIENKIKDVCISLKAKDYVDLPPLVNVNIMCTLPDKAMVIYKSLEEEFISVLKTGVSIVAPSCATLQNKLLQCCNGNVYGEEKEIYHIHDEKIKALEEIVDANPSENILVAYNYKFDLTAIQKAFPHAVVLDKSGDALTAWNAGKIKMLLAHPASCGHGLNAQFGGNCIVWFGVNWSLELYQQFNARLHRSGQIKPVKVFHLLMNNSVDEIVMKAIEGKSLNQEQLLGFLRKRLLPSNY